LLALNPDRFRGDLEILASSGQFRVLRFPFEWQARLLPHFKDPAIHSSDWMRASSSVGDTREPFRLFLMRIVHYVAKHHRIDCVVGAAVHYVQDADWGAAFKRIGIPYIVFHKENLVATPAYRDDQVKLYKRLGTFEGDHIVVHNDTMKAIFVESGFATDEDVTVCGAMRMDRYLEQIKGASPAPEKPRVTLFSFHHVVGITGLRRQHPESFDGVWSRDGSGFVRLFNAVHSGVARFASENPDVEVVIKTKWGGRWLDKIRQTLLNEGLDPDELSNLRLDATTPAQDLILTSNVVCAFGSTTVLEAAIAGKPVVMPLFEEACVSPYQERVLFGDRLDLFDVATSRDHLVDLLTLRLTDSAIPEDTMERRRGLFEQYVSRLSGTAVECHVSILEQAILRREPSRSRPRGRRPQATTE
jgi:hypothetical protein